MTNGPGERFPGLFHAPKISLKLVLATMHAGAFTPTRNLNPHHMNTTTTTTTMNTNPMLAWAAALWAEEARRAALNARLAAFERDEKAP